MFYGMIYDDITLEVAHVLHIMSLSIFQLLFVFVGVFCPMVMNLNFVFLECHRSFTYHTTESRHHIKLI